MEKKRFTANPTSGAATVGQNENLTRNEKAQNPDKIKNTSLRKNRMIDVSYSFAARKRGHSN